MTPGREARSTPVRPGPRTGFRLSNLQVRLTLLLMAIVSFALIVVWIFTGRHVITPFTREVMDIYVDEAVYVADQLRAGADPRQLGKMLKREIRVFKHPPPDWEDEPDGRSRRHCQRENRKGYEIMYCRGKRAPIVLETDIGYVLVLHDLDLGKPAKRVGEMLLMIAVGIFVLSAGVAALITRPLTTTTEAMARIAAGDLAHRLPVSGGPELAEAARMFNAMADRMDTLLRAERELMAGISHELRTPLARLRLTTELLREVPGVPERRLAAMETDLEEVDALIAEILEHARLSLGDRALVTAVVDLNKVVAEARARHPLPAHRLVIAGQGVPVLGDHVRLVRVVSNILENAGKYAPEGTEVQIVLDGTAVEVMDRGPGVPESELPRIFEPFYRGAQVRSSASGGGLGLGLMIARQVVTLHGGTIAARNREDGGLSIRIELPAPPADAMT